jgi:hypothetical protein
MGKAVVMSGNIRSSRVRLAWLAALLLAGGLLLPGPRGAVQRPGGPALLFLSPNTESGLSLEESLKRLATPVHERSRRLAGDILRELAAGPAEVRDAIGDWEGGVENSLLVILPAAPDVATLRCAAAWFGLAADQKAVLAFRPDPRGPDVLATLALPAPLPIVRALLDRHGVRGRTILFAPGGCEVIVLDEGGRQAGALAELTREAGGRLSSRRGEGVSLTAATRKEARRRYREVLRGAGLAAAQPLLQD